MRRHHCSQSPVTNGRHCGYVWLSYFWPVTNLHEDHQTGLQSHDSIFDCVPRVNLQASLRGLCTWYISPNFYQMTTASFHAPHALLHYIDAAIQTPRIIFPL